MKVTVVSPFYGNTPRPEQTIASVKEIDMPELRYREIISGGLKTINLPSNKGMMPFKVQATMWDNDDAGNIVGHIQVQFMELK